MPAASGALEKLTIISFTDPKLQNQKDTFAVMFNPTSFSVNYSNSYDQLKKPVKGETDQKQLARNPRTLSMELFLDGTGTSPSPGSGFRGAKPISSVSNTPSSFATQSQTAVDLSVNNFMAFAYDIDAKEHRTLFLVFVWGDFLFAGVLESANVTYSLFASDGKSLRAKISISAKEHITEEKLNKILRLQSPDLTHSRIITAGDTLPNLSKEIYGDESLYLEIAQANNLRNYRKLIPGQSLIFPPVEKIKSKR